MVTPNLRCCKQKGKEKSSTNLMDLPLDIVCNVLSRLSSQILGRLKLVCKAWRDLISNPHFVLRVHLPVSRVLRPCLIFLDGVRFQFVEYNTGSYNVVDMKEPVLRKGKTNHQYLISTCNGLLCFVESISSDYCAFHIMNPVTGEKMQLPDVPCDCADIDMCQLLWDEEAGPWGLYKVLLIYRKGGKGATHTWMFSLGVDCVWRCIFNPYKYWRYSECIVNNSLENPRLRGAIHRIYDNVFVCHAEKTEDEEPLQIVAVFDIKTEKFRAIKLPMECSGHEYCSCYHDSHSVNLIELWGFLCFFHFNDSNKVLDVWLLKDYNEGLWVKIQSMGLTLFWYEFTVSANVFAKVNHEKVLILLRDFDEESIKDYPVLLSYNPRRGTLEMEDTGVDMGYGYPAWSGVFTGSLVPLNPIGQVPRTTTHADYLKQE